MTKLLLLLALPLLLNASKILSYNVYDRTDRVDVMITFDTPYEGKISQSSTPSTITIKLEDASIETTKTKTLASKFLSSISIVPLAEYTKIVAEVPASIEFKASKTSDSYGLRLRFSSLQQNKSNTVDKKIQNASESQQFTLPTKKSEGLSTSYIIVVSLLILGSIILLILKSKISTSGNKKGKSNPWLFKVAAESKNPTPSDAVTIRFQKVINDNNSVVMLDFLGQSYLVLMGANNILLDKFTDNKPITQDDFETILQNRHQELDDFLNGMDSDEKDPMQIYKEKAAKISYTA